MRVTKANILKVIKTETGLNVDLDKHEGEYYWTGKIASLFDQRCTHYTTLSHPNITVNSFVDDFKSKVKKIENEFGKPVSDVINSINWNI